MKLIPNANEMAKKDEVLRRSHHDLIYFGRAFLPNDFMNKSESPPFHFEISKKLIDSAPGSRVCNIIPRGFGKSILSKAAILHKILFSPREEQQFICWVAEEQGQAIDHLKYIKTHLEYNNMIKYYFGNLCGDAVGNRWTEKDIVTSAGDRVMSKGTSQRLRGRSEVDVRYTGIVLDDFESELNTKTPERRQEIKQWIVSTVYPALEESKGREGWIWLLGTIVHYDSFLQMVLDGWSDANRNDRKYPWDLTFYKAINDDGTPLWGDQFSLEKLENKRQEFIEAGLVNKFAQEYMNDARDISTAAFKTDRIKFHDGVFESKGKLTFLNFDGDVVPVNVYIGVDLAATATNTSDFQAVVVLAVDNDKNRYVLEYFKERIPTFDVPDVIIKLCRKYAPVRRATIETVAAQEMVRDMLTRMEKADRRLMPGLFKGVKPLTRIKKEDRLETALGPIVNSRKLYIRRDMTDMVDEFFEHPMARHDDLMDALYYADYFAKPPKSGRMTKEQWDKEVTKQSKPFIGYNWLTGGRF
jgi:phage terminase large subunit-like protein